MGNPSADLHSREGARQAWLKGDPGDLAATQGGGARTGRTGRADSRTDRTGDTDGPERPGGGPGGPERPDGRTAAKAAGRHARERSAGHRNGGGGGVWRSDFKVMMKP